MTDKEKYINKSLHKINGVLVSRQHISTMAYEFVIEKGSGKKKRNIRFITFIDEIKGFIGGLEKRERIKVRFKINSFLNKTYWNTQLIAMSVLLWEKGSKAKQLEKKQAEMFNESELNKGLGNVAGEGFFNEKK